MSNNNNNNNNAPTMGNNASCNPSSPLPRLPQALLNRSLLPTSPSSTTPPLFAAPPPPAWFLQEQQQQDDELNHLTPRERLLHHLDEALRIVDDDNLFGDFEDADHKPQDRRRGSGDSSSSSFAPRQ